MSNFFSPGQDYEIKSTEEVRAVVGENVILPCHTKLPKDLTSLTVVWRKGESFVHLYRNGQDDHDLEHQQYRHRTILFHEDLVKGNLSLKLLHVQLSDQGNYTCSVMKRSQKKKIISSHVSLIEMSVLCSPKMTAPLYLSGGETSTQLGSRVISAIVIAFVILILGTVAGVQKYEANESQLRSVSW
uniref:Ig-like domain-containing protein n=1 Tax=Myripristis murdjan TaxID=586833 RepID=A0A667ZN19_9TELE